MLDGFDVNITQNGAIFTVSGKDADRLYERLQKKPEMHNGFVTGALQDGTFTLEKIGVHTPIMAATVQ